MCHPVPTFTALGSQFLNPLWVKGNGREVAESLRRSPRATSITVGKRGEEWGGQFVWGGGWRGLRVGGTVTPRFLSPLCRINYPGGRSLRKEGGEGGMELFFLLIV